MRAPETSSIAADVIMNIASPNRIAPAHRGAALHSRHLLVDTVGDAPPIATSGSVAGLAPTDRVRPTMTVSMNSGAMTCKAGAGTHAAFACVLMRAWPPLTATAPKMPSETPTAAMDSATVLPSRPASIVGAMRLVDSQGARESPISLAACGPGLVTLG